MNYNIKTLLFNVFGGDTPSLILGIISQHVYLLYLQGSLWPPFTAV